MWMWSLAPTGLGNFGVQTSSQFLLIAIHHLVATVSDFMFYQITCTCYILLKIKTGMHMMPFCVLFIRITVICELYVICMYSDIHCVVIY